MRRLRIEFVPSQHHLEIEMHLMARTEDAPPYADEHVISRALEILASRLSVPGAALTSPGTVRDYLRLQLAESEREIFGAVFLDAQHRVIAWEALFFGTLSQASVYPREVVKRALALNASAVILAHNHPSGNAEPSRADEVLTGQLKAALALVDVRVIDHFIVGGAGPGVSFAERGLL